MQQSQTSSSSLEPLVAKLTYRVKLSGEDRAAILALPFTVKRTERGQFLVRGRELASHSCVILSGYCIRSKITATGDRQIVSIHMKGEVVDLQNSLLKVADHSVQMLTPGKFGMSPRDAGIERTPAGAS